MIRTLYSYLLLAGLLLAADNLLKNPDFSCKEDENSVVEGWRLDKDYCNMNEKSLKINLKSGQTLHLRSDVVNVEQQERRIRAGLIRRGARNHVEYSVWLNPCKV